MIEETFNKIKARIQTTTSITAEERTELVPAKNVIRAEFSTFK
jgi:hypothetical protein